MQINTAILSYGMSGQLFHAPFIHVHSGFNFYAVWERSKNLAVERYPDVITYRTLDELLADEKVELVIVNTPNYTHYEFASRALGAGKHVIVEKPFTVTVIEAEQLIALAANKNLVLSVYQNRRYDSDFKTIRKVLQEQRLGRVVEAEFHFDRYRRDLSPKQHKETPGPGTGALYDLGSHLIDQAVQLFGVPQSVFADIRMVRAASQVDDYFEVLLYYPELRVRLHSSYLVREALPGYVIHGELGTFIKPKTDVQEMALQAGRLPNEENWGKDDSEKGFLHTERAGEEIRENVESLRGNYMEYFNGIHQSLRNGAPPPVSAKDGLTVIKIIAAAFESSATGCVIRL